MKRVRKPVHFAYYGQSYSSSSVCGLIGGRNGKGYKRWKDGNGRTKWQEIPCDFPWTRLTVKFEHVTCEDCLVLVVQAAKKKLHARLAEIGSVNVRRAVRKAHGQRTMGAVRALVGV